jgi:hypothetical protein
MAYAELAALRPRAGGGMLRRFGLLPRSDRLDLFRGRLSVPLPPAPWCWRLPGRFTAAGNSTRCDAGDPWAVALNFSPQSVVAVAAIYGMAWIRLQGVGPGRVVSDILAVAKSAFVLHCDRLSFGRAR